MAEDPPPQLKAIIPWEGFNELGPGGGFGGIPEVGFVAWIGEQWMRPSINQEAEGPEPAIRAWTYDLEAIDIPALVCGSFSDQELHTWDTLEAFMRMRSADKWLYSHRRQKWGAYYGRGELAVQKRFLDRFLKGESDAMAGVPRVRLEVHERRFDYKVVEADAWPLPDTDYQPLYLDARDGSLGHDRAAQAEEAEFTANPEEPANRAVFDHRFAHDTDLIGYMALRLWVELEDVDDIDLFVGVEKLDREGNEVYFFSGSGGNPNGPVSRGWLRVSRRALDPTRSTDWHPYPARGVEQPLSAGEIVPVDIAVMPSGTTFREGERLRLVIQGWSADGQFDDGAQTAWDRVATGRCRIHTGGDRPSRLLVPVVG